MDMVARITYGLPAAPSEAMKRGEEICGGCCIENDSPLWHCGNCGHNWGRVQLPKIIRRTPKDVDRSG